MGKRSTSRRVAMQAIYQADMAGISIDEALNNIFDQEQFIDETREFALDLATAALGRKDEIDAIIAKYSKNWPLERMNKVDKSILRLAIYEIISGEMAPSIVINEALELAKKYSANESAKFINGILGAFVKERN
ncbi:MAG: transcription antitermination factor NusB [Candidatus Margulisbacteria bacterium]|nr:transcription antitermination factor NusB [Candidatus Margulisiibacteriota bacterium]